MSKKSLPTEYVKKFEDLTDLMNPTENFKKYRTRLKEVERPLVPYLGLWLTDLTFIDDGNPKVLEDGLFNFEKAEMVNSNIHKMIFTK